MKVRIRLMFIALALSLVGNIALLENRSHPFQDPQELQRALFLGWSIRGIEDRHLISTNGFQQSCFEHNDYDNCREAIGNLVLAVRAKFHITGNANIPTPQASANVVHQRGD